MIKINFNSNQSILIIRTYQNYQNHSTFNPFKLFITFSYPNILSNSIKIPLIIHYKKHIKWMNESSKENANIFRFTISYWSHNLFNYCFDINKTMLLVIVLRIYVIFILHSLLDAILHGMVVLQSWMGV